MSADGIPNNSQLPEGFNLTVTDMTEQFLSGKNHYESVAQAFPNGQVLKTDDRSKDMDKS